MKNFFDENNIRAFVFDMDGVLIDSESVYEKAWQEIAGQMGFKDIDSVHKKCLGCSKNDVFEILKKSYGENIDAAMFWKKTSDWSVDFMNRNGLIEKDGAKEILTFLKSENILLALATSSEKSFAENLLKKANLLDFFDAVVFGDEVKNAKPNPDIYLLSCAKLNLAPKNCAAVEDSPNGIISAKNAGLKAIMVPDRILPDNDMKKNAWKIFDSLLSLRKTLINSKAEQPVAISGF